MTVGIVGGGLQGLEAAYLARKAGWQVRLLDWREEAPARGLCDSFRLGDAADSAFLDRDLLGVDLVLPALEDTPALENLSHWAGSRGAPLAFDLSAYAVSSSKQASNRLFRRLGLRLPRDWPECGLPVLVKPDGLSGSRGVRVFREEAAWRAWLADLQDPQAWVLQEYLEGPSFSIEVLGSPDAYRALQVTALDMDAVYDCKRVRAPAPLDEEHVRELERLAVDLAEALELRGLMDVEVILHEGRLKLLEIDARLPSQTPITVFWSAGYNMVSALAALFLYAEGSPPDALLAAPARQAVVLEHVRVAGNRLEVSGEHVLARRGPLRVERDFFGADEAITDRAPGRSEWVATLIATGGDAEQAWRRRCDAIEAIRHAHDLDECRDPEPPR
jgi:pyrrolysine biosynthesis protein PylC